MKRQYLLVLCLVSASFSGRVPKGVGKKFVCFITFLSKRYYLLELQQGPAEVDGQ